MKIDDFTYRLEEKAFRLNKVGVLYLEEADFEPFTLNINENDKLEVESALKQSALIECANFQYQYIYFSKLEVPEKKRICCFCKIKCRKDTEAVFVSKSTNRIKIYNNYRLVCVNNYLTVTTLTLSAGDNLLIFDFDKATVDSSFSLRVNSLKNETEDELTSVMNRHLGSYNSIVQIFDDGNNLIDKDDYEFTLIPNNHLDQSQQITVNIMDAAASTPIDSFQCGFYEKISYPIARFKDAIQGYALVFEFTYQFEGKIKKESKQVIIKNVDPYVKAVTDEARYILDQESGGVTDFCRDTITGYIKSIAEKTGFELYWECSRLSNFLAAVKRSRKNFIPWENCGYHCAFYRSKIDNSLQEIHFYVPKDYSPDKKYPLFLAMSTSCSCYSYIFRLYNRCGPVISVDIGLRGVTLGSYFGEQAVLEALDFIKQILSIDENRIYLFGYSNGAHAAWMLAENYPDFFAGILSVGGAPSLLGLENLSNMRILSITSEVDSVYKTGYLNPDYILRTYPHYKAILTDNMNHDEISLMIYKECYYDDLLQYKREPFPLKVQYVTYRNRHRKAYWVELHAIAYGEKSASIHAEILNESNITVYVKNATGFTLTVPPQMDRDRFTVSINEKRNVFKNCRENKLYFYNTGTDYIHSEEQPEINTSKKGLGLLDIYLDTLTIVVPDRSDETINKIASAFSKPVTSGYVYETYVNYPVFALNELTDTELTNNLVLLGNPDLENYADIKNAVPIKTDQSGFSYKGIYHACNYVVMQAFANPYDCSKTILAINSNNNKLLRKNYFTRIMHLSSYFNGVHPYLNNEALIFMGNKYWSIYEWGNEIEEINPA